MEVGWFSKFNSPLKVSPNMRAHAKVAQQLLKWRATLFQNWALAWDVLAHLTKPASEIFTLMRAAPLRNDVIA
eukprot:5261796-Pyramimonas_sp.AAC.1